MACSVPVKWVVQFHFVVGFYAFHVEDKYLSACYQKTNLSGNLTKVLFCFLIFF